MKSVSIKALSIVIAALGVITACSKEEPPEEVIRPVRYIEVKETAAGQTRTFAALRTQG